MNVNQHMIVERALKVAYVNPIAERLEREVEKMMRDKEAIQCVVMNAKDFQDMTGKDPQFVADFGCFLGIPIVLGDRTHVRPTLHFRLLRRKRDEQREGQGDV